MPNISTRTEGMVGASANYYQESEIFKAIQNAQALEYDRIETNNKDLALQLSPLTATWGLAFWEEALGLPIVDNTDYEIRRPVVLARLAKSENFSTTMIQNYAQTYGGKCTVTVDVQSSTVTIIFVDALPNLFTSFREVVEKIIHAHLGTEYSVKLERRTTTFVGVALQDTIALVLRVSDSDIADTVWFVDENNNILIDENDNILLA